MGKLIFGDKTEIYVGVVIIIYLFGALISKMILTGKVLSFAFIGVKYLEIYNIWIISFFIISSILSFGDIKGLKSVI
jgi:hypothetical protein